MPILKKFWALFSALVCLFITGSAYAGSGPEPVQLVPSIFRVSQVLHEPGVNKGVVIIYGASGPGMDGSYDSSRLMSTNGGIGWSSSFLTGPIQTADTETTTFVCSSGSVCVGKAFVARSSVDQIYRCDIAGDGLTTSNCSPIPNFQMGGLGMALRSDGQLYVRDAFTGIQVLDPETGNSVAVSGCGLVSVAGGPVNGKFYAMSNTAPNTLGSYDFQFFNWNGTSCSSKDNLNNLPYYANINTSGNELEGAIDALTGDYFYTNASNGRPMWAKHDGVCGDGFLSYSAGEECDPNATWLTSQFGAGANLDFETCGSLLPGHTGTLSCDPVTCTFDTSSCSIPPSCGDAICNNGETCSTCPGDCGSCCGNGVCSGGETCSSCSQDCGACPTCGDGNIDAGEDCDGANLNGQTCASVQGAGWTGSLSCSACDFNTSGCLAPPSCGDGTCNTGETCSTCPGDCGSCCGNGQIDSGEACDGTNLNGHSCMSLGLGFVGGDLACDTCQFDTDQCTEPPSCGDGTCGGGETCSSCTADCGSCCGNDVCETQLGENPANCSQDCGTCNVLLQLGDCTVVCINLGQPKVIFNGGGDCHLSYTPPGAPMATSLVLAASAGQELNIPVQPFGTPTQVAVPQGVNHRQVVDNGNEYVLTVGGVALGVEGTAYSADWISQSAVRFTCTDGLISLSILSSGNPLDFNINGTDGELPAGFTVDVDVLSGTVISGPALLTCGDGNIDDGEACDGNQMNGQSCTTMGFDTGTISCNDDCTINTSGCENGQGGAGGSGGSGAGGEGNTSSSGGQTTGGNTTSSSGEGGGDDGSDVNAQGGGGCTISQPVNGQTDASLVFLALVFGLGLVVRRRR